MTATQPPRGRGRPKGGNSHSRERLLDAGLTHFARFGYEGASLRKIAAEAGCDMAMIAHHFGSKGELWAAVVDAAFERNRATFAEWAPKLADPALPLAERLRIGLTELFDEVVAEPRITKLLMQEMSEPGERLDHLITHSLAPWLAAYLPLWKAAQQAGVLAIRDPVILHLGLLGALSLLVTGRPALERIRGEAGTLEEIRVVFVDGILERLRPTGRSSEGL